MKKKLPLSFYLFQKLIASIPPKARDRLYLALANIAYFLDKKRSKVAKVNLDLAFGDKKSPEQKREIAICSYKNLIRVTFETILLQGIKKDSLLELVEFENSDILEKAIASKRPIIFITAHYGNWELGTLAIASRFNLALSVVGRPLDWKWANEILVATREQFGVKMIPKNSAMKMMVEVMKRGGALGLVVDQNTSSKQGLIVDFFSKEARHTPTASILARKFNATVIPVFNYPIDYKRYKIKFYPPIDIKKSSDSKRDILTHTQKQANITEDIISKLPNYWLWLHKRWKNRYEELYK